MSILARHLHCGSQTHAFRTAVLATCRLQYLSGSRGPLASSARSKACGCSLRRSTLQRAGRSRRKLVLTAAWGQDIEWGTAKIVKTFEAAKGLQTVIVEIGSKAAQQYEKAGQYLQLKLQDSKPGFFAIASAPGQGDAGTVELLVKNKGDTAELLCSSQAGTTVEVSPVSGPGFRIEKAAPEEAPQVFMFATGSGISPIKALIESGALQADKRQKVRLFYGTYDAESTAFKDLIPSWEATGIQVVPVYSSDGRGYVQDVFEKENEVQDSSKVAVLLCGHKEMAQSITAQMLELGVDKERILLNF